MLGQRGLAEGKHVHCALLRILEIKALPACPLQLLVQSRVALPFELEVLLIVYCLFSPLLLSAEVQRMLPVGFGALTAWNIQTTFLLVITLNLKCFYISPKK